MPAKPKSLADWLQNKVDDADCRLQEAEADYEIYTTSEQRFKKTKSVSKEVRKEYNRYVKDTKNNG